MLNQIKWAIQRVTYGYDDRIFWGFDCHFSNTIIPPLKKFCSSYDLGHLNPERQAIYTETLRLIAEYEKTWDTEPLAEYFGKHIGWYWD